MFQCQRLDQTHQCIKNNDLELFPRYLASQSLTLDTIIFKFILQFIHYLFPKNLNVVKSSFKCHIKYTSILLSLIGKLLLISGDLPFSGNGNNACLTLFISAVGVFVLLLLDIVFRNRLDYKENGIVSAIMVEMLFFL